jgi:hypothetical protein
MHLALTTFALVTKSILLGKYVPIARNRRSVKPRLNVWPVSTKSLFRIWAQSARTIISFLKFDLCSFISVDGFPKKIWNVIVTVGGVFDKTAILFCFAFNLMAHNFSAAIFVYTQ